MNVGALRLAAPAKLNLSLAVTGRRGDGYHELSGVMVLLELADELLLVPGSPGLRVVAHRPEHVPVAPAENLAWRGLRAGLGGEPLDCCLTLEKRVPVLAGLGGGSSDAAAAWRLGRAWSGAEATPDVATLVVLAAIGADVPFFAAQAAIARVSGIGEQVSPLALPAALPRHVLLVLAPSGLSTRAVFGELRSSEATRDVDPADLPGRNDLLAPALRLQPALAAVIDRVRAAGLDPHLTGSGPTLFALDSDPERLASAAARLERGGLRTLRTRIRAEPARIERVGGSQEEP